jgi:DnaJ-class molecular chaperone
MVEKCPVCRGAGQVKIWEAVDPKTKQATGWYRRRRNEKGEMEYEMKPCPYCKDARKLLVAEGGL